ncbi:MAG TPA: hypothetical protein VND98_06700 [Solirubrobacterales bacterium]|nr:hypothetical protein [Solirubrobacterales bacterium]
MVSPGQRLPPVSVEFREPVWEEEVRRLNERSPGRLQAERARREIEAGREPLNWKRCEAEGSDQTMLTGCRKLYVPLDAEGASAAPFGFVFRLSQNSEGGLSWNLIAFGERHPDNQQTRSVYERAHKRLHGRYPYPAGF